MVVWSRMGAAAAALPLLAACTGQSCSAVGCGPAVSVDLRGAGPRLPHNAVAQLCVDGDCRTAPLGVGPTGVDGMITHSLPSPTSPPDDGTVLVTLTITSGNATLVSASLDATLLRTTPNGEQCAPECWSAALALDGTRLVPLPPS